MFPNSKSKGGSLKDVHVEDANISWASGVYNNIKKLVFNEIKLYVSLSSLYASVNHF